MTDKPDNQMEQRLEEYARRRRAVLGDLGGPIELHEATRTMLQGEVSREYGQSAPAALAVSEPAGIPWLGWALGGAAVGAVALVISIFPSQPNQLGGIGSMEMVKADAAKPVAEISGKEAEKAELQANVNEIPGAPGAMADRGAQGGSSNHGFAGGGGPSVQAVESTPPVHPAHPTRPLPPAMSRMGTVQPPAAFFKNLRELRQEFEQDDVESADRKNALPKPVLVKFQIERNGNQIRVLDGDGSVYEGVVINEEEIASEDKAEGADKLTETAGLAAPAPAIAVLPGVPAIGPAVAVRRVNARAMRVPRGQFFFRASGTNKTLRKRVIIEATFDNPVEKRPAAKAKTGQSGKPGQNRNRLQAGMAKIEKKDLNGHNIQAVRAIARMRVLGNARIGKANFRIDAYQRAPVSSAPSKAAVQPAEAKKK